ncbi:virulence factor, partial [Shigella flexneri]|nr:type III secretion system effector IcsB [Shigella flexneri]EFX7493964.1 virulence factor [Shigella flexneri]EHI1436505.1 type III secretion system effector IcsB [Shigella flexneri]EIW6788090.1 type III secretion system effector IcsB [Shigella flexneri]EJS6517950.1 type III secretion system effector IcsB [Shigella flexneri]
MILKISNFIDASNTKGPIRVEDTEHGPILIAQKFNLKDLFFRTLSTINAKINSQILNEQLKNYRLENQKSLLLFLNTLASEKSAESAFAAYEAAKNSIQHSFTGRDIKLMLNTAERFHGIGTAKNLERHLVFRCWGNRGITHLGHTSISIKNNLLQEPTHTYLSWYPGGNVTKDTEINYLFEKRSGYSVDTYKQDKLNMISDQTAERLDAGQEVRNLLNSKQDQNNNKKIFFPRANQKKDPYGYWGVSADKVYIPLSGDNKTKDGKISHNLFGLDETNMSKFICKKKADAFRQLANYKLISKSENCAGMALNVLKAGNSEIYFPLPDVKLVATPNDVYAYANKVRQRIESLNQSYNEIMKYIESDFDLSRLTQLRRSYLKSFNKINLIHTPKTFKPLSISLYKHPTENVSSEDFDAVINACHSYLVKSAPSNMTRVLNELKTEATDKKEEIIEKSIKIIDYYNSLKSPDLGTKLYIHDLLQINKLLLN